MGKQKLNVLLAKTDHLASVWKTGLKNYAKYFQTNQGAFKGIKKTYAAKEGTVDEPKRRDNRLVVTTVGEKLDYFEKHNGDYIDALFSLEKTNSSGLAKAKLTVDDMEIGEFTSLELLRLKTILESEQLRAMYEHIPVRSDSENWDKSENEMYENRQIYETKMQEGVVKTTVKEPYILEDPNVKKGGEGYIPQVVARDITQELGDYTHQEFSGEWSHRERAELLARRTKLLSATITALKEANEAEAVKSEMTAEKLFRYLHG